MTHGNTMILISGGQTGADRAALDWAIHRGIPHGGWCPKGRLAEDGILAAQYLLRETSTSDYAERTERNVLDADGTVIFTLAPELTGGCWLTAKYARDYHRPWLHISAQLAQPAACLRRFRDHYRIYRLNVAGSRASKEATIGLFVRQILEEAFP